MFDAQRTIDELQEALRVGDTERVEDTVSDRMIWTLPVTGNTRGKREWIDASTAITWNWFRTDVRRVVEVGDDVRIVEFWVDQSRQPVEGEDQSGPVLGSGIVLDVWVREGDTWRVISRHPQRAQD